MSKMFKFIYSSLFVLLLVATNAILSTTSFAASSNEKPLVELDLYLINDFQGQLRHNGDIPGAATLASSIFELGKNNPGGTIILGGGDMIHGTLDSKLHDGIPAILALNNFGFSASVLGTDELIYSKAIVEKQQKTAAFPFLAANIIDKNGTPIFSPYKIIERKGLKIAIIGLANNKTAFKVLPSNIEGYTFQEPSKIVNKYIQEVKEKGADVVVLLTHLGINVNDGKITGDILPTLETAKNVDAVFAASNNKKISTSYNNIPVVEAGVNGTAIGRVHLLYSRIEKKVIAANSKLYNIHYGMVSENEKIANLLAPLFKEVDEKYGQVIANNVLPLSNNFQAKSAAGDLIADFIKKAGNSEIAIINGGSIRTTIPNGPITLRSLLELYPYDGNLVTMNLKGSDLIDTMENAFNLKNTALGRFSGLKITADMSKPLNQRILSIVTTSDGLKIKPDKYYKVVTNDYLAAGGSNYLALTKGTDLKTGPKIQQVLEFLFRSHKTINYTLDDRLTLLNNKY